jgi:hypothetical protein
MFSTAPVLKGPQVTSKDHPRKCKTESNDNVASWDKSFRDEAG